MPSIISALLRVFATRPRSLEEHVLESLPRYRAMSSEVLRRELLDCEYFRMTAEEPEGPNMADTPAVRGLLIRVEAGEWDALLADWPETLTALALAERDIGLRSRPMLLDYDIHLTCLVRVLAERGRA